MKTGASEEYDYLSPNRQQDQMNGTFSNLPSPLGKNNHLKSSWLGEGGGVILARNNNELLILCLKWQWWHYNRGLKYFEKQGLCSYNSDYRFENNDIKSK